MKRSPLLARADLLRALALAGGEEDRQRRYAGLLAFERQPVVATVSGIISPVGQVRVVVGPAPAHLPKSKQESLCARPCSPSPPANVSNCPPNAPDKTDRSP
jgi:hypothetical protein